MTDYPPRYLILSKEAAADAPFKIIGNDLWLEYADVFVTSNSGALTDRGNVSTAAIYANDVYTFPYPVNIFEVFFKNLTAGLNCVVTIVGTTLTRKKAAEYGISLPD